MQKTVMENEDICLCDDKGNRATLRVRDKYVRLMKLSFAVPADGKVLLDACETESLRQGKDLLVYDFRKSEQAVYTLFQEAGFELKETDSIISVSTSELLGSTGVEKSLRMKFPNMETVTFFDMMTFQKEEVKDFLEQHHFPVGKDTFDRLDERISAVTYDDKYNPRAILLASHEDGEILVELLMGFSSKNPQYTLAVCQEFVESIIEYKLKDEYPRISMLTMNAAVVPLLRRLMNKGYELVTESVIIHAEKRPQDRGITIAQGDAEIEPEDGLKQLKQNNINEKYMWGMERK